MLSATISEKIATLEVIMANKLSSHKMARTAGRWSAALEQAPMAKELDKRVTAQSSTVPQYQMLSGMELMENPRLGQ